MLKSNFLKWTAALLIVPAIPVLAKTAASARTSAIKPAAGSLSSKPATSADSNKLADAIAALSKPTAGHTTVASSSAKPTVHTALATTGSHTHLVKSGETFGSISKAIYGSSKYWSHIAAANPKVKATSLRPGMILIIPAFTPSAKPAVTTKPKPVTSTVKPATTIRPIAPIAPAFAQ